MDGNTIHRSLSPLLKQWLSIDDADSQDGERVYTGIFLTTGILFHGLDFFLTYFFMILNSNKNQFKRELKTFILIN